MLKGKRVLITGGSAGLGAAVATRFAALGAHIAINYAASSQRATALQSTLKSSHPESTIIVIQGDVSQSGTCEKLIQDTVNGLGGVDCVVSNAGWTKPGAWDDLDVLTEEEWDRTWAMNVKAHLFLLKAAKPHFLSNENGGNMIITTSIAGLKASGSSLAYSVTKTAAIALTKGLALHQGPNIRVNNVAPGLIETDWSQQFGEAKMKHVRDLTPLKKITSLEDCAEAFVFLASNSAITGQTVVMDGGFSLRTGPSGFTNAI